MLHLTKTDREDGHAAGSFFADYGPVDAGRFDEVFFPDGTPRPHWRGLLDWLGGAGEAGYLDAAQDLARLRTESGLAFAASDAAELSTSDALPVVISAQDWAALERGIAQRARLADAAVTDIYTDRRTVSAGLLPPGVVYGNPGFAAHCAGWKRPPRHWVHIYEADVARTASGQWVVLSDRLDTPLGDGWMLANRIAASQAYADLFVDMGVRRVASHYAAFQEHLEQMMGWEGRMALLTAGENDPRFFSHAYFARYMSAALVEPADLTVRDGAAFVKTLDGLKRLDVLLRGVPDESIDALHQPWRAAHGAPAMSLAARSGAVKIVNAIGAGAFAHRALAPYAHRLAQHLLGEDLLLADAPCLWLGGERAREQVLAEPDRWRIEALTSAASFDPPGDSDEPWEVQLARYGERLCAVETPELAQAPAWVDGTIRPGPWMMRVFACRTPDGWTVAAGGVASVVENGRRPPALGFGKDVWVLPEEDRARPAVVNSLLGQQASTAHLRRTGRELLSRVADELFWLGRNAERAEAVLRVLSVCLARHLSGNRSDSDPDVLTALAGIHIRPNRNLAGAERYADAITRLVRGTPDGQGLPAILGNLRSGALRARASISAESWLFIDRLSSDRRWRAQGPVRQNAALSKLIEDGLLALAAFAGSAQENLTRNYAWRFLELGRRIERGMLGALAAERLAGSVRDDEATYLRAWLTLSDSAAAYRSRYMLTPQPAAVADLLILDETNPRSLAFQMVALERVLADMPTEIPYRRPEHRRALSLLTELRLTDPDSLMVATDDGNRQVLDAFTKRCEDDLAEISNLLSRAFFAHAEAPEALLIQARMHNIEDDA
ncbi:MAG: circularly permuted type 2 ATP-grasp protein [Pseudomonadota bacterium]